MTTERSKRKCPNCDKGYLDSRISRPLWMKIALFWLPIRRFKCSYCNKKTYVYGSSESEGKQDTGKLQSV